MTAVRQTNRQFLPEALQFANLVLHASPATTPLVTAL